MADGLSVYNSQLDAFELYHQIQEDVKKTSSDLGSPALPALGNALAGAIGASISNICTYPLAMVITRLQTQRALHKPSSAEYTSISDAFSKIFTNEGGFSAFYTGVVPDTTKTIADAFLFFFAYTLLRRSRLRSLKASANHLPVLDELSVGFLAGAFSKFFTTPIANIVTRVQTSSMLSTSTSARSPHHDSDQNPPPNPAKPSAHAIALQILRQKGIRGFWTGYAASLILTLNPSLTFFFFETLKRLLLPRGAQRTNPSARAIFVLAALSKAGASGITYPVMVAKARLQAGDRGVEGEDDRGKGGNMEGGKGEGGKGGEGGERAPLRMKATANVLAMLVNIARIEGGGALYDGLAGELLKGFFSHGITMLVKEAVHGFVVRFWFVVARMLRRVKGG